MQNNIIYPSSFNSPESRVGKKFNFFKVEPYSLPEEKKEPVREVKFSAAPSGRISSILKSQASEDHLSEVFNTLEIDSFSDIISDSLLEATSASNTIKAT